MAPADERRNTGRRIGIIGGGDTNHATITTAAVVAAFPPRGDGGADPRRWSKGDGGDLNTPSRRRGRSRTPAFPRAATASTAGVTVSTVHFSFGLLVHENTTINMCDGRLARTYLASYVSNVTCFSLIAIYQKIILISSQKS